MPNLDGSTRTIQLNDGYQVRFPGYEGEVRAYTVPRDDTTRAFGGPLQVAMPFVVALERGGFKEAQTIELRNLRARGGMMAGSGRSIDGPRPMLTALDYGPRHGQVIVAFTEGRVVTWIFPEPPSPDSTTSSGLPATTFQLDKLRLSTGTGTEPTGTGRGLVDGALNIVLKVLIYPLIDPVLGAVAEHFATAWENQHRPHQFRTFEVPSYAQAPSPGTILGSTALLNLLNRPAQAENGERRALVFLHGAFSQGHSAFNELPPELVDALHRKYGGRVVAFDHPTMSASPVENAQRFVQLLSPEVNNLTFDCICHSRGGLVARALAKELAGHGQQLSLGKVIFCASPNYGTPLADGSRWRQLLDQVSTALNLLPPPAAAVTSVLEGLVTAVKIVGAAAVDGLPGLSAMNPALLKAPADTDLNNKLFYGICTNYEPSLSSGLALLLRDEAVDVQMGEANDLVVPTVGVLSSGAVLDTPLSPGHVFVFPPGDKVAHFNYFAQPETQERLKRWLNVP